MVRTSSTGAGLAIVYPQTEPLEAIVSDNDQPRIGVRGDIMGVQGDVVYSGVSSEAVAKATGRDWTGWLEFLDGLGARELDHKGLVALLAGPGGLDHGWWQQTVAVGYGQARGLRVVGQTAEGNFQIGVQKTLPLPADEAWTLLTEDPGRTLWLGHTDNLEFVTGEQYGTSEGTRGAIRSLVPGERVRLTWHHPDLARPSTLQIYVAPSGEKASVRFHQERLSSLEEREQMRRRWKDVLEELLQVALIRRVPD